MSGMSFGKGMITGLMVGAAVGFMVDCVSDKSKKKIYKNASRFFTNIGCAIDGVVRVFR